MTRLPSLLFDDSTEHPLELDKSEHRDKQVEIQTKRDQLREKRKNLKERRDELKQQYVAAKEAGNDDEMESALRDAERIDDKLETVNGKLDVLDQMSQTVSNFINVYEMRELRDDEYWERLMELDREELVEMFSQEKLSTEDMVKRLDTVGVAVGDVVDAFSDATERLHGSSELREEWEEEYDREHATESAPDPEDVFGDLGGELDDEDVSDLQLS